MVNKMAIKHMSRTEILRRVMKLRETMKKTYDELPDNVNQIDLVKVAKTFEVALDELKQIESRI